MKSFLYLHKVEEEGYVLWDKHGALQKDVGIL
jgi:hypothetical protein